MRNFIYFLINNVTTLLFLLIEVLCVVLIVNFNSYQRASFWSSSNEVCGTVYTIQSNISEYFSLKEVNEKLATENVRLRNLLSRNEALLESLSDSSKAVFLAGAESQYYYREAQVINSSTNKSRNYLTLNKGTQAGIKTNMVVVNTEGVVGMVTATSEHFSTVMPIINTSSHLSVKLMKSHFRGQLIWNGVSPTHATMRDVPEHATVEVGDSVVTSGSSSYYPEGLFVGIVKEVNVDRNGGFYNLTIDLGVNYASIYNVQIIENTLISEQTELEKENVDD